MAKKKSNSKNNNFKKYQSNKNNQSSKREEVSQVPTKNTFVMKLLVFLGVIVFLIALVYLMNYFFVEKSYLKINMSTDKKLEYLSINNKDELLTTQKFVSDLDYSMRYDIKNFSVFKYKSQDIYKFVDGEKILVVVEHSKIPDNCTEINFDNEYNNCIVKVDNYTEEHYISNEGTVFKITIKTPNVKDEENITKRIEYMIDSFEITIK